MGTTQMENEVKTPKIVNNVITESPLEKSTYWQGHGEFGEIQELKTVLTRIKNIEAEAEILIIKLEDKT